MSFRQIIFWVTVFATGSLVSCTKNPKSPGKSYMPDMTYSEAYETYSPNPNFTDGQTARQPVPGTIARGALPSNNPAAEEEGAHKSYFMRKYFPESPENYEAAATGLKNPIPLNDNTLAEGKKVFEVYCMVCHGAGGDGKGSIVVLEDGREGPFPPVPNYKERLKDLPEGKMFYSITYGKGLMGSYSSQVSVEERWKVIYYIQKLSGTGRFAQASDTTKTTTAAK